MGNAVERGGWNDAILRRVAASTRIDAPGAVSTGAFRIVIALGWIALACAALPTLLFLRNLRAFRAPRAARGPVDVAILIPARDEEINIASAVEAALGNAGAEVLVLDDGSSDRTYQIVCALAASEPRLRVLRGEELPPGWTGKNFACAQLAAAASHPLLLFVDADVRLAPDAACRLAHAVRDSDAQLISGIPRQEVGTFSEKLLLPLIQFLLLGFLPLERMRRSKHPAYGSACGQLIIARRDAYERSGGHRAIRHRVHDGLALPKQFRASGFHTDLVDVTDLATCRMYRRDVDAWSGLAKNTHEGLGAPARIVPVTLLLLGGQVLPFALAVTGSWLGCAAAVVALVPRVIATARFHQPVSTVLLHPFAIVSLVAIQWYGLARWLRAKPVSWKGRSSTTSFASANCLAGE